MFKKMITVEIITIVCALFAHSHGIYSQTGFIPAPEKIITENGHIWEQENIPAAGCFVKVIFDDMGTTDDVTDDVICEISRIK